VLKHRIALFPESLAPVRDLVPESATVYYAHGRPVAVVFPGEAHGPSWHAALREASPDEVAA